MREMLNEEAMEQVVGGTVVLSEDKMMVGFTTTGEKFSLKCAFDDAFSYVRRLKSENGSMSNAEFDAFVRDNMKAKGWI